MFEALLDVGPRFGGDELLIFLFLPTSEFTDAISVLQTITISGHIAYSVVNPAGRNA